VGSILNLAGAGFMEATIDTRKMLCHRPSARHPALGLIQGSPPGAEVAARDPTGLDKPWKRPRKPSPNASAANRSKRACKRTSSRRPKLWWQGFVQIRVNIKY
jgi:hypothetical protein